MARQRIGARRHFATAYQHDGTADAHNMPTYSVADDWDPVVTGWPCELITAGGGEVVRGRQTTAQTTHVFFGEPSGGKLIGPEMRLVVDGVTYAITAAFDPDGDQREWRVEAKIES